MTKGKEGNVLHGRVWKYGDDVDTDVITPARYLNVSTPQELALHCMEDIDPSFVGTVRPGDIIVAGENFGCGSSREHAPLAIKGSGVACVVAKSFARIFYRNAINIGLPILECPEAVKETEKGDQLTLDLKAGTITNLRTGRIYRTSPFPDFIMEIIQAGGLVPYTRRRIEEGYLQITGSARSDDIDDGQLGHRGIGRGESSDTHKRWGKKTEVRRDL